MRKCKILSVFFAKLWLRKQRSLDFLIKNNKHYVVFLSKRFTRHFNILEQFLSNLRSEKIAWVQIVKYYRFFKENIQFKTNKPKEIKLFLQKDLL